MQPYPCHPDSSNMCSCLVKLLAGLKIILQGISIYKDVLLENSTGVLRAKDWVERSAISSSYKPP